MRCPTPDCDQVLKHDRLFCPDCWRLVPPEQREALRMCYRSPLYGVGSWPIIDGAEVLLVSDTEAPLRGVKAICDVLHGLEWRLLVMELGRAIRRLQARKAARARLAARRCRA